MMLRALILTCFAMLAAPVVRADVLVFAAASLKEPLDQIAAEFDGVVVSYGGSGTLARQVDLGAPADLVLLANVTWMEHLVQRGSVAQATVSDFASNSLVLIASAGSGSVELSKAGIADALNSGRLAVGLTNAVPAGIYAKTALQALDLWGISKDHLAEVDNVRAALALVARGQTPLGIVYRTDVRVSDEISAVADFPATSHPPIRYVGALVPNADPQAQAFWTYLRSDAGQAIFAQDGFLPPVTVAQ